MAANGHVVEVPLLVPRLYRDVRPAAAAALQAARQDKRQRCKTELLAATTSNKACTKAKRQNSISKGHMGPKK